MQKPLLFISIVAIFIITPLLLVNAQELPSAKTIIQEESITVKDLEVGEPTLLPSSPFYFLKNWARGVRKALTFNPVRKAELELHFADEKIAEAKKLVQQSPQRTQIIERALETYRTSQEKLKAQFQALKETSQNPQVDNLLEKLADRSVKHEKLFNELKEKFEDKKEVKEKFELASNVLREAIIEASKKDEPEKFVKKLEKALVEVKGSDFKHITSLNFIDRLQEHEGIDVRFKEKLDQIRNDFSKRLTEDLEEFIEERKEAAPELISKAIENLPGDKARHAVIIKEIGQQAEKRVQESLKKAQEVLDEAVSQAQELEAQARKTIDHAREKVKDLEKELLEIASPPLPVKRLFTQAATHLERAVAAFEEKKFGEAFGQARSAEVLARNALRLLEEQEKPEDEELKEDIQEFEEHLNGWERRIEFLTEELRPKAKEALGEARFHLRLATESLSKGALREAKKHLEEAKHFERTLERIFHEFRKRESVSAPAAAPSAPSREEKFPEKEKPQPTSEPTQLVCTQEYEPVCGVDGKTYPNQCHARVAGVGIKYKGECGKEREGTPVPVAPLSEPEIKKEPEPVPFIPSLTELKVEADDKGFYPSNLLTVPKGAKVKLTFFVRKENVYFGGLDFRSEKFKTESVKPGGSTSVEFTADESFTITSYWPASGVKKTDLKVEVK